MPAIFRDRTDAGNQLAAAILAAHPEFATPQNAPNTPNAATPNPPIILGLARGGIPVAAQVAKALHAPLDAIVVRKLGLPSHEEYAFGALAPDHTIYLNEDLVARAALAQSQVQHSIAQQQQILTEREAKYRAGRAPINLTNRIAILTDDGIATGATMRAAVMFARKAGAAKVIVAVPVAPDDSRSEFESLADEFICPNEVADFAAVGKFYGEFGQVEDAEVIGLLAEFKA